jgi:hypothetical protein
LCPASTSVLNGPTREADFYPTPPLAVQSRQAAPFLPACTDIVPDWPGQVDPGLEIDRPGHYAWYRFEAGHIAARSSMSVIAAYGGAGDGKRLAPARAGAGEVEVNQSEPAMTANGLYGLLMSPRPPCDRTARPIASRSSPPAG